MRPGLLVWRNWLAPHVDVGVLFFLIWVCIRIWFLGWTSSHFQRVNLVLQLSMFVLEGYRDLIYLLVLKSQLMLLHLLLVQVLLCIDEVVLSKLTKHLQLVVKLVLAVHHVLLLVQLPS